MDALCELLMSSERAARKLAGILAEWHGSASGVCLTNNASSVWDLYRGIWQDLNRVVTYNRLLAPNELTSDDDRFLFYIESQGTCAWAFDTRSSDPSVWRQDGDRAPDWIAEEERLTGFLLQVCLFESVMAAKYGAWCSWCDPATLKSMIIPWQRISISSWRWPSYPTTFWCVQSALAVVSPNEDGYTFRCGALNQESLELIKPFLDTSWEYVKL